MTDARDQNLDGIEDQDTLEEQADANRPYGQVTAEDLSTDEQIYDGGDLATAIPLANVAPASGMRAPTVPLVVSTGSTPEKGSTRPVWVT